MYTKRKVGYKGQVLILLVVGFSISAYFSQYLTGLLLYNRQAILNGEVWRIFTAPMVHFSISHIFWDLLIFTVFGFAANASGYPRLWVVCCLSAFISGLLFLIFDPELEYYGGLSGLATGVVAYYCLCNIFWSDKMKKIWVSILVVTGIKIIIEIVFKDTIFVKADTIDFRVLPSAHIAGCLAAVMTLIWSCPGVIFIKSKVGKHFEISHIKIDETLQAGIEFGKNTQTIRKR